MTAALNIMLWLIRPFLYLFTGIIVLIVLAMSTTVVGIFFGYVLLMLWVSLYEWIHAEHNRMRGRQHQETWLSNIVRAYSGGV